MVETVKARLTWEDVLPFPGNPISPGRLRSMRKEWGGYAEAIVGTPAIADNSALAFPGLPEDSLVVIDGNHRRALAEEDGRLSDEFVGQVFRGLSRADVHRRRRGLNDRRTIKPAEEFLERVEEGDLTKREVKRAVEGTGWRITYERAEGGLPCTNELQWIFRQDKGAMIRAIETYEAVWGRTPDRAQTRVIKGLGAFWIKYPEAEPRRLVRGLKHLEVGELYRSGKKTAEDYTYIKSVFDGIRHTCVMEYNRVGRKGALSAV